MNSESPAFDFREPGELISLYKDDPSMSLTLIKNTWYLRRNGARHKTRHEQIEDGRPIFREHTPTDKQAWYADGKSTNGLDDMALFMLDPNQYDAFGPLPATVDTPTSTVVTLYLRVEIDKATGSISESVLGGPGMDTETIVRHAYRINGRADPDAEGLAWWVGQINTGRWTSVAAFLADINAVFVAARKR